MILVGVLPHGECPRASPSRSAAEASPRGGSGPVLLRQGRLFSTGVKAPTAGAAVQREPTRSTAACSSRRSCRELLQRADAVRACGLWRRDRRLHLRVRCSGSASAGRRPCSRTTGRGRRRRRRHARLAPVPASGRRSRARGERPGAGAPERSPPEWQPAAEARRARHRRHRRGRRRLNEFSVCAALDESRSRRLQVVTCRPCLVDDHRVDRREARAGLEVGHVVWIDGPRLRRLRDLRPGTTTVVASPEVHHPRHSRMTRLLSRQLAGCATAAGCLQGVRPTSISRFWQT